MMHLIPGSRLQNGKYTIVKVLGQGGFGITYQAKTEQGHDVAVKEFFMKDTCVREQDTHRVTVPSTGSRADVERYRQKFIKEAMRLQTLDHPNIVKVYDVFEENGTNYYVMQFMPGGSLSDNVKKYGPMGEALAKDYILQVALALRYMHQEKHICHYDVKPGNILLDNGKAVLIDFGLSKNYDGGGRQTSSTPVGISAGYAPLEQYQQSLSEFSPVTDIYALGATLYFLLSGTNPPEASVVLEQGLPYPSQTKMLPPTWNVICQAMMPVRRQRLQNIDAFCWALDPTGGVGSDDGLVDGHVGDGPEGDEVVIVDESASQPVHGIYESGPQSPFKPDSASSAPPKTWLVQTILVMLFCCLPFGIVALVHSLKINDLFERGHCQEAYEASTKAGTWVKVAFFAGLAFYGMCLSIFVATHN